MPYKITIEKTESVTTKQEGPYVIIARVPWTDSEINDKVLRAYGDESKKEMLSKEPLREVRGYAPDRDKTETKATKLYEQCVDDLNLKAVINAINS